MNRGHSPTADFEGFFCSIPAHPIIFIPFQLFDILVG